MNPTELADTVSRQVITALNAPVPFLAALLFFGWLIWLLVRNHYKGRLETKDELIRLREGQAQDYKEKLSGATPDEAKKKIELLERQIKALQPKQRSLSADQEKKFLAEARKAIPVDKFSIIFAQTSHESAVYADQIAKALQKARWPARADYLMDGTQRLGKRGISIAVKDVKQPSAVAKNLARAFKSAGIKCKWEADPNLDSFVRIYVDLAD